MTGNFKIRMVENNIDTQGRWYIHVDNIDEITRYFYHLKNIDDFGIKHNLDNINLFQIDKTHHCKMYSHDIIRPLTISEYITLGNELKRFNMKYNKKQDKLI